MKKILYFFFCLYLFLNFNVVKALDCEYKIPYDAGQESYFYYKFSYTYNEYGTKADFIPYYKKASVSTGKPLENWSKLTDTELTTYNTEQIIKFIPIFNSQDKVIGSKETPYTINAKLNFLNASKDDVSDVIKEAAQNNVCPSTNIKSVTGNNDYSIEVSFVSKNTTTPNEPGDVIVPGDNPSSDITNTCSLNAVNENLKNTIKDGRVYVDFFTDSSGKKSLRAHVNVGDTTYNSNEAEVIDGKETDLIININNNMPNATTLHFTLHRTLIDTFYKQDGSCYTGNFYITDDNAGGTYFWISDKNISGYTHGSDYVQKPNNSDSSGNSDINVQFNPEEPRLVYSSLCDNAGVRQAVKIIGYVISLCKWVVPFIIIVLGMVDFVKAMIASDEKALSKATSSLIKRIVAGIIVILIPTIVMAILNATKLINGIDLKEDTNFGACTTCLFKPSECGKGVEINNDNGGKPTNNGSSNGTTANNSNEECLVKQWDSRWGCMI